MRLLVSGVLLVSAVAVADPVTDLAKRNITKLAALATTLTSVSPRTLVSSSRAAWSSIVRRRSPAA